MTIKFLVNKIVPDFPVKIRHKGEILEEHLAGDIQNSSDKFYFTELIDCTFYRTFVVIDI